MDAIIEARVRDYLRWELHYDPYQVGAIVQRIRDLSRMAGHIIDERFAFAGLGAGPEARVATSVVKLSLGKGGAESSEYAIRKQIELWLITSPPTGAIA